MPDHVGRGPDGIEERERALDAQKVGGKVDAEGWRRRRRRRRQLVSRQQRIGDGACTGVAAASRRKIDHLEQTGTQQPPHLRASLVEQRVVAEQQRLDGLGWTLTIIAVALSGGCNAEQRVG